jgi:hypothetical protein
MSVSEDLLCAFELLKVRIAFRLTITRVLAREVCGLTHRCFAAARHGPTQARARQDSTTAFVEFVERFDSVVRRPRRLPQEKEAFWRRPTSYPRPPFSLSL